MKRKTGRTSASARIARGVSAVAICRCEAGHRCRRGKGRHLPPLTDGFYCATQTLKRSRRLSRLSAQNFALTMKPVFMLSGFVGRSLAIFGLVLAIASLLPGP